MQRDEIEIKRLWLFLLWTAFVGAILLALIALLRQFVPDAVRSGSEPWPLEVWAGALAFAYLIMGGIYVSRAKGNLKSLLPLACLVLVGLTWLMFVRQQAAPKWDFGCYYQAGAAIRHGVNIYDFAALGSYRYLYSPFLAVIFSAAEIFPVNYRAELAFLGWSIANYWAVMVFFLLLVSTLRLYGIKNPYLWPIGTAAVICNVPLQRTLIYSQVNLHVLNLCLGFLLLYRRRPSLAGGLLAGAVVLKTSPILLLFAVIFERSWRAMIGFIVGMLLLVGGSIALVGTPPWIDFLHVLGEIDSHGIYRDNSIQSDVINLGRIAHLNQSSPVIVLVSMILTIAAVAALVLLSMRSKYRAVFVESAGKFTLEGALPFFLSAMVIASPLVWEHHWIFLLLPFLLLTIRAWGTRFLLPALLCYGLVFLIPTFDVYALSYHRLAGLVWWILLVIAIAGVAGNRQCEKL